MRMPRSAVRRRLSSRAAMRLNHTISRCAFRITTPFGRAAVERCSCRMSCTKRCLWKRLRRCSRTICAMISPHTPPTSGGSAKLRWRSHHSRRNRLVSTQVRCKASAHARPPQTLPSSQPAPQPITTVPSKRPAANHHACVAGSIDPGRLFYIVWVDRALYGPRREPIARAADRLHEAIVTEILERLAQPPDMHVDGALLHVDVAAPDTVEQLIARVDALGVRHEELEHAVFGRTQGYRTLPDHHPVTPLIEDQAFELDALIDTVAAAAPQDGVDPRQQLPWREGLGHIIIRAALEACDFVPFLGTRGQHDDRKLARLAVALEGTCELQATHVGEHPVHQHQVGARIGKRRAGAAAVLRLAHFEAGTLEAECDHLADRPFIFNDQNLFGGHRVQACRQQERGYYRGTLLQLDDSIRNGVSFMTSCSGRE